MLETILRTARYARSWLRERAPVRELEVELQREGRSVPGTFLLPEKASHPLPSWIVLHGITRPGRFHPELRRFGRALAASRAAVLVPEVPEWVQLQLSPDTTVPTVLAGLRYLGTRDEVENAPPGLVGFSFGAPQAAVASADPRLTGMLAGVVGFGGYCDLERTVRFLLTGIHEWRGKTHCVRPDPYGRWIVAANYLTEIPGHEDAEDAAGALWTLAAEAGDRREPAWHPTYDRLKRTLRAELDPAHRSLFDLLAPPSGERPDRDRAEALVVGLADAARRSSPLTDPTAHLDGVRVPVRLLHGRGDRLLPFTETLRLAERLPDAVEVRTTVTELFGHSGGERVGSPLRRLRESVGFVRALADVLDTV